MIGKAVGGFPFDEVAQTVSPGDMSPIEMAMTAYASRTPPENMIRTRSALLNWPSDEMTGGSLFPGCEITSHILDCLCRVHKSTSDIQRQFKLLFMCDKVAEHVMSSTESFHCAPSFSNTLPMYHLRLRSTCWISKPCSSLRWT